MTVLKAKLRSGFGARRVGLPVGEVFAQVHGHLTAQVIALVDGAMHVLKEFGCATRDRSRFDARVSAVLVALRTAAPDAPPLATLSFEDGSDPRHRLVDLVLADFGMATDIRQHVVKTVMNASVEALEATGRGGAAISPDPALRFLASRLTMAFIEGVRLHARLVTLRQDVARPYRGIDNADAGVTQVVELMSQFPLLADLVYADLGWTKIAAFPPELQSGAEPDARTYAKAVAAEHARRRGNEVFTLAGIFVAGLVLTVVTAGLAGPVVATLAGAGVGMTVGTVRVAGAASDLQRVRDSARLGGASATQVSYQHNELIAAWGGLVVDVVSLGLASRLGGGSAAKVLLRGALLGTGTGAATALVDPNVWESDDMLGTVVIGAVIGGGAGVVAGSVAYGLSPHVVKVGIPNHRGQPPRRGDTIQVQMAPGRPAVEAEYIGTTGNQLRFRLRPAASGHQGPNDWVVRVADVIALRRDGAGTQMTARPPRAVPLGGAAARLPTTRPTVVFSSPSELKIGHLAAQIRFGKNMQVAPWASQHTSRDVAVFELPTGQYGVGFRGPDGHAYFVTGSPGTYALARLDGQLPSPQVTEWIRQIVRAPRVAGPALPASSVDVERTTAIAPPYLHEYLARLHVVFAQRGGAFDDAALMLGFTQGLSTQSMR